MNRDRIQTLASGNKLRLAGHVLTVHAIDTDKEMVTLQYVAPLTVAPEDIPPPCVASYDPTRAGGQPTKAVPPDPPAMLGKEGWKTTVICKWAELRDAEITD